MEGVLWMENFMTETNICAYCGCDFVYIGQGRAKYCSKECSRAANNKRTERHPLNTLGTTKLSGHRIKDFKKEKRRIKIEKWIIGI